MYELGIRSENIEIRALFAAKKAEMSEHIETLIAAIRTKIKILETSAQSWFGIGNGSKARQLSEALARAEAAKESCLSLDTFLRYKQDGLISIEEALTIKRIGFSNPNSKNEIDNLVEELTGVKPGKK